MAARGFTLIELLVVLAIMGLVFMIAAPHMWSAMPRAELKSGVREVSAVLREARSRAIQSNGDVVFTVDVDQRSYAISGDRVAHRLPKTINISLYTAQQELAGRSAGSVRFFPDGTSTGGHLVLSSGDISYKVNIDWLTGRVEVQDQNAARAASR